MKNNLLLLWMAIILILIGSCYNPFLQVTAQIPKILHDFIEFEIDSMSKTYGDPVFTIAVNSNYKGTGSVTYSSSDANVAVVNQNNGEVIIKGTGETVITAVKAADVRYAQSQDSYVLTVSKTLLTISAADNIINLNDAMPELTYDVSGLAYNDTRETAFTGEPDIFCACTDTGERGSYPIIAAEGTMSANNYEFAFLNGTLSIGLKQQDALSITESLIVKTWGDSSFTLNTEGGSGEGGVHYSIVSGEGVVNITGDTVTILKTGTAEVIAQKIGDNEYNYIQSDSILIIVNKRNLSNAVVDVGGTFHYIGHLLTPVVTVTDNNLVTASDYITSYGNNINAGTAAVTVTASQDGNYTGTKNGAFTIAKAILTVTADDIEIPFNADVPVFTYTVTGFVSGEDETEVNGEPVLSCGYVKGGSVGMYEITAENGNLSASNYAFHCVNGELAVGLTHQTPLVLDEADEKTYGDPNFYLSYTGGSGTGVITYRLVNGSDVIEVNEETGEVFIIGAGTAEVDARKEGDSGHTPVVSGVITIVVNKRDLSNVSVSVTGTFHYTGHEHIPAVTVTDNGYITASDYAVVYSDNINAGTAVVTIEAAENGNYAGTQTETFIINKVTLTLTAHNKNITYSDAAPAYTHTTAGFVNGEDGTVLTGSPSLTSSYAQNSNVGSYTITITQGTLASANYSFNFINGTLTVGKINPTVTWPANLTAAYGQTLSNITLPGNGISTPAGTFEWIAPSAAVGAAGTQPHNMQFTPADTENYNTLTRNVDVTVNKANPVVTWPTGLMATYGQTLANITLPGNGTSSPAGAFAWVTSTTSVGAAGTRAFSMRFTPTDTANYNTLTQNVSITVNKANPVVTWPTGLTAAFGQTLSNITLPGNGTSTPAGAFTWVTPTTSVGAAGTRGFSMRFTPTDTTNYNILTQNVNVTVGKTNPTVTWPTGLTATYGQTLANITLPGNGTSTPAGAFAWVTSTTSVGAVGTRAFSMNFTPTDTANYNTLTQNVNVTVNRKAVTITGVTSGNKEYNGNTTASFNAASASISGNIDSGNLTINTTSAQAVFSSKDAGSRTVTFSGFALSGTAAGNYTLSAQPASVTANITAKPLTLSVTANMALTPLSGETTAAVSTTVTGIVTGDSYTINYPTATGLTISNTNITYNGTTAFVNPSVSLNYSVNAGSNYSGGTRTLTITVYDGQANFTNASGTYDRRIPVTSANIAAFNTYANTENGQTRHYKLTQNVTLTPPAANGRNWTAIGTHMEGTFTGSFDGQSYAISNLTAGGNYYQGMFGVISNASVRNLGLVNTKITGQCSGGIAGTKSGSTTIENCYVTGTVDGMDASGGIVGENSGATGIIKNCYSTCSVSGSNVGGIAGYHVSGSIINCYATGSVSGNSQVGGIVGSITNGTVQNCYATGSVSGTTQVGGIAGSITNGTVRNCYATGNVNGTSNNIGGIAGSNGSQGVIRNCYTLGAVTGVESVGGIAGISSGIIEYCYAAGVITGSSTQVGGIAGVCGGNYVQYCIALNPIINGRYGDCGRVIGYNRGTASNNRAWEGICIAINGAAKSSKGNALNHIDGLNITAAALKTRSTWTGANFDFTDNWNWAGSNNYMPSLLSEQFEWKLQHFVEMIWIPAGTFLMGENGNGSENNVTPVHQVTLTQGFYMGKYQVTQEQYIAVIGSNPSSFHGGSGREPAAGEVQSRRPVEQVSWYDALVFCNKLSMMEGLTPAYRINNSTDPAVWGTVPTSSNATWDAVTIVSGSTGYRLPTEAQWEYAAKGGNLSQKYIYSGSNDANEVAWYSSNSGSKTHEAGLKKPNELGLYDMSGNVGEWCWGRYSSYTADTKTDPMDYYDSVVQVYRGGEYLASADRVRSAYRDRWLVYSVYYYVGFRVVRP